MDLSSWRWALLLAVVAAGCGGTVEAESPSGSGGSGAGAGGAASSGGSGAIAGAGGAAGGSGSSGADAGVDAAVPCGDPDTIERFHDCRQASNEVECEASGGDWMPMGMMGTLACNCPTGQAGCPCRTSSDCLSVCVSGLDLQSWACTGEEPTCLADSNIFGCYCYLDDKGEAQGVCVD